MHMGHLMPWSADVFTGIYSRGPPKPQVKSFRASAVLQQFPFVQVSMHNFFEGKFGLERETFCYAIVLLGTWQRGLLHLHQLESEYVNLLNLHPLLCLTTIEYALVVRLASLHTFGIILISPASPCAMSWLIPSPRSRQHNSKHIYYTLECHTFPPHISFYCVAPVFCSHFLWTSNKALISFKEQGRELMPPSSKREGMQAARVGAMPSPYADGGRFHMKTYLLMDTACFAPSERLPSVLDGFYEVVL